MDDFGGGMEGYDDNGGEELGAIISKLYFSLNQKLIFPPSLLEM